MLFEKTYNEIIKQTQELQKHPEIVEEFIKNHPECSPENMGLPKCPTCGSTNIQRISSAAKVGNAMALGFFGNKRRQQFECLNPNCRYRW